MRKSLIRLALCPLLLALCLPAEAQQQAKVPKIGWLAVRVLGPGGGFELVRRELRALGYVEGKNIAFEYRSADNKVDRVPPWLMSWSV
jgi:putative tryptophan/tyrosine transport system substrate-binding protein